MLTEHAQIKCGDHDLKAEVTIIERPREKVTDGQKITLKEPPAIVIRCVTCGREAATHKFVIDTQLVERIFQ